MKVNLIRLMRAFSLIVRRFGLVLLALLLATAFFTSRYQLALNMTESLSGSVFLIDKSHKCALKGELVAFTWKNASPIPDGITAIKRVVGVAGDTVSVQNREVFINGSFVGRAKETSRTGEPLKVIGDCVIPKDHFFAAGDHPDSFDSRYEAPGLISTQVIKGRAYLLW